MTGEADQRIHTLQLAPHPEGGHYRRVHASERVVAAPGGPLRPAMTAITFLLKQGERSRWHRVDADELWHWQAGGALCLQQFDVVDGTLRTVELGPVSEGHVAMAVVPAGQWQRAWTSSAFAQVGCVVAPGFTWEGFALLEQAPEVGVRLQALGVGEDA